MQWRGAEVAYDFTSNGVGQILSESLSNTLAGEDLVWRPAFSANDNYASNGLNPYTSVTGVSLGYDGNGNLTNDERGRSAHPPPTPRCGRAARGGDKSHTLIYFDKCSARREASRARAQGETA